MFTKHSNRMFSVLGSALMVTGLAVGMAWGACNGEYCGDPGIQNCAYIGPGIYVACCVDLDGDGVKHCAECIREYYLCNGQPVLGPAFSCSAWSPIVACS